MDLLQSLNLSDLPEQQTHISPYVQEILDTVKNDSSTSDLLHLGFNVCCSCATNEVKKSCPGCHRVRYCSQTCLDIDCSRLKQKSKPVLDTNEDTALGHTAVICSLLQLCQIDEDVEEYQQQQQIHGSGGNGKNNNVLSNYTQGQIEAAQDRIRSEYESYPATISNILIENPYLETCLSKKRSLSSSRVSKDTHHQDFNASSSIKQRRSKRDREQMIHKSSSVSSLVIHVVGASNESELWGDFYGDAATVDNVYEAYVEAFVDLANAFHLHEIYLIFIGPKCSMSNTTLEKELASSESLSSYKEEDFISSKQNRLDSQNKSKEQKHTYKLMIETYPCDYDASLWKDGFTPNKDSQQHTSSYKIPKADVIFFFNPGFTCPDYTWDHTIQSLPKGIPLIIATNTEMEALADIQYFHDQCIVSENAEDILELLQKDDIQNVDGESSNKNIIYFGENPFSGLRVRQNGTMANDLYVKNRWIFIVDTTCPDLELKKKIVHKEMESKVHESKNHTTMKDKDRKRKYFI